MDRGLPGRGGEFVAVSALLTGFSVDELEALGLAEEYAGVVAERVEAGSLGRLAGVLERGGGLDGVRDEGLLETARAVTHLWYTGCWPGGGGESPFVVSPRAYAGGLVWRTFGGSAPGAERPGFGVWGEPPGVPSSNVEAGR
ncbi:sorbitol dehydrogenase family protein [Streptomyces sp. yr375]|uniref:sorbitol dehydrogenase family protein n=1 Tax=Streptomyces sp. yr375 TaxID=1761906 RepID=UPI00210DBF39|nr:sorbitol dehydrogenase family protein [Streptomyces sp. yr375]